MRNEPGNRRSAPAMERELCSGLADGNGFEVWLHDQIGVPTPVLSAMAGKPALLHRSPIIGTVNGEG